MDLSALLAREGIQADDADVLVAWARQRAAALVARIEPGSALAQQLGATLEQARSQPDGTAADVPVALTRPTSRGSSRPARSVSRPYLGAAVQAALSRNEPALERALETAEIAVEDAPAPTLAPAPTPAPAPVPVSAEPEDEDASIGGFNRFAFSVRRRAIETREDNEDSNSPTLTRGFELHAEESTSSGAWQVSDLDLPAPPGFETRAGQDVPADRSDDAEASGGLVVGIPDEEGIDIPVPRARPRSESRGVAIAPAAPSGPHPEPQAARSSEVLELDSGTLALEALDIDIPAPPARENTRPQSMARLSSGPQRAAPPPPPPARSGPHARASGPVAAAQQSGPLAAPSGPLASRPPSAPQAAASRPPSAPQAASRPPSAPSAAAAKSSPRGRSKTATAEQKQVKAAPEPKPAANKRGKGRKKIVELGQPVAAPQEAAMAAPRKHSIGNHVPTSEPSTAGRDIPAYLQDDDE